MSRRAIEKGGTQNRCPERGLCRTDVPHAPAPGKLSVASSTNWGSGALRFGRKSSRLRKRYHKTPDEEPAPKGDVNPAPVLVDPDDPGEVARRRSWARMLQRIFETDPLTCPKCGETVRIVGFVTQPAIIDKILKHRRERQLTSPFESRAPPAA